MTDRIGNWIQTYSGIPFYPLDPREEEIAIIDIAHSLSMQCRYAGHCLEYYSVAEHCCLIHDAIEPEHKKQALMHDASEAYLVDLPRPVKNDMPQYKGIETKLEAVIFKKFGIPYPFHPRVKDFDTMILVAEKDQNMVQGLEWNTNSLPALDVTLKFWSPKEAKFEFLSRFNSLFGEEHTSS